VLAGLLTRLKATQPSRASWLYIADHGQDVSHHDNFSGHNQKATEQWKVPMLLWQTPQPLGTVISTPFQADTIALHMQIHFLESLTTILNKIPIAGYLIFGDDGSMAITLNIHGSLYNPKVETEATKDLVKAPLNILERTLTLPFKLFE